MRSLLWIEDVEGTVAGTLRGVQRLGIDVVLVGSSGAAASILRERKFDLLIVDYQIPPSEGEATTLEEGAKFIGSLRRGTFGAWGTIVPILLLTNQAAALPRSRVAMDDPGILVVQKLGGNQKVIEWVMSGVGGE